MRIEHRIRFHKGEWTVIQYLDPAGSGVKHGKTVAATRLGDSYDESKAAAALNEPLQGGSGEDPPIGSGGPGGTTFIYAPIFLLAGEGPSDPCRRANGNHGAGKEQ
jgi:hypothetical protein